MEISDNQFRLNSLGDFATCLGAELSSADTMAFNKRYAAITLNRALLSSTYMEEGIIQVLIDQPVDDAFRGGLNIQCDELDEEDMKILHQEIETTGALRTYSQALKWMRLFGGAGVLINIGQDLKQPFSIDMVNEKTPLAFYAADRWELSYAPAGMGAIDQFSEQTIDQPFNYYGHVMHKSNVIKLNGKEAPSLLRGQFGGWGMSELEKVVRSFNQYLKHQNVSFELLDEAKIDVFKIQGFNSAIATKNGAQLTANRVGVSAQIKNYQNALVLDSEDEYEQKTMQFTGLAEMLTQIRTGLACDLRMPMSKLFGIQANGLNASGEDDIENYNAMVETEIRSKVRGGIIMMLQILCKKIFGFVPETLNFEWHPLRMMSSNEQSILKSENLNRIVQAFGNGLMSEQSAVDQINHAKVFDLDLNAAEAMTLEDVTGIKGSVIAAVGEESKTTSRTGRAD